MTDQRQQEHYPGFGGKIGRVVATSESWWPPEPIPAPDAPNVVVVLANDLGFSDLGCYGSEIPTPAIDALAAAGVRYTNFHVTPLCSPTRAALLTGLNPHHAGMGFVANSDPGFPGYAGELPRNQLSYGDTFAIVFILALIALIMNGGIGFAERKALRWQTSHQGGPVISL